MMIIIIIISVITITMIIIITIIIVIVSTITIIIIITIIIVIVSIINECYYCCCSVGTWPHAGFQLKELFNLHVAVRVLFSTITYHSGVYISRDW